MQSTFDVQFDGKAPSDEQLDADLKSLIEEAKKDFAAEDLPPALFVGSRKLNPGMIYKLSL